MKPAGLPLRDLEEIVLGFDEAEALRLADLEGLYQEAAARSMGISRQTFGRIVEGAHRKVADALLNGKAIKIEGGEVVIKERRENIMKIAVPARDGYVDDHFGHCKEFVVFGTDEQGLVEEASIPSTEGCGCKSGIASILAKSGVTHLVAGNMGEGAVRVLASQGIKVVRGAHGRVRDVADAFFKGSLVDSGQGCSGHGEQGHEC
jgi:predicted DNA-binding protein (UPF0251 family)/predicted Fe-Mo cluster-binding NifX family protein